MDDTGMPLNAEWHPDLRFVGSPVLRNARIPTRNLQDTMTTLPVVLEFAAFLGDEANADARIAAELPSPDEPHPTDQQLQPTTTLTSNLQDMVTTLPLIHEFAAFLEDEANADARTQLQPHLAAQRLVHVFDDFIDPILRVGGAYFTHPMMNSLHIPCVPLDLITGDVAPLYRKYFQPMGPQLLNHWIHDTTTGAHIREYKARVGIDLQHENNYAQAMSIWRNGVAAFLSAGENHNHLPNLDPALTPWRVFNNGYIQLQRREGNGTNWSAEAIFHFCTEDGLPDDTRPHVVAFVADEAPLMEGIPSTSAVQAAMWLAGNAAARDGGRNHNIFPVTVICCSGHKARIVQVVINLFRSEVQIRLSEIVDFRDPSHGDWIAFLRFLCWFLPDPIGDTNVP
ncbi:unnamed protein product [Clonostachys rhizophaga]|uniref:Uncharacterized protein n=1 Tax=Clonostachys rhizophaga TaxID=160324 RepID=A0A9N9YNL1_9HYPO|nr:unnamed protein product [Clonostachys rhizophaga]